MNSYLVAGAGGFIGSHLVEQLRRGGDGVVALDRPGAELSPAVACGATVAYADLADGSAIARALEGCEYAINATGLFDLAASDEALHRVNVAGARDFALAARSAGVRRLVHLSSVGVYGAPAIVPCPEDAPMRPRSAYERSKLEGERSALELSGRGIEVAAIRPTLVYGPRSRYGHALFIALAAQLRAYGWRRFPIFAGGPLGHHVHAVDVARAAILCSTHPNAAGRAFNVADDHPMGLGDSVEAMATAAGFKPWPRIRSRAAWSVLRWLFRHLPDAALRAYNRRLAQGHERLVAHGLPPRLAPRMDRDWLMYFSGEYVFDTRRIRALGFAPQYPEFRRAIGDVFGWYAREGWLPQPDRIAKLATARRGEEGAL